MSRTVKWWKQDGNTETRVFASHAAADAFYYGLIVSDPSVRGVSIEPGPELCLVDDLTAQVTT